MKKIISLIYISVIVIAGCKKDPEPVSVVADVGHPNVVLNGPTLLSVPVTGGTYTDSGAIAYDDIKDISVTLTSPVLNEVDLSTPGFYRVIYEYSTSNGLVDYTDSKTRFVLVSNVDPNQDISGLFARTANGVEANVTKHATGIYSTDNVGGVGGNPQYIFDVYFGVIDDSTIQIPIQPNSGFGGDIYCDNASLSLTPDTSFSWVVHGIGFGLAQRTFVRM